MAPVATACVTWMPLSAIQDRAPPLREPGDEKFAKLRVNPNHLAMVVACEAEQMCKIKATRKVWPHTLLLLLLRDLHLGNLRWAAIADNVRITILSTIT